MNVTKPLLALIMSVVSLSSSAQADKIKLTPTGRLLVDFAAYAGNDDQFKAGAEIPEARLGLSGDYDIFRGKLEVGVAYGKLVLKDIYINADFTPRWSLRVGNYIQPYGLQSAYNASMKTSMEQPTSNAVFDLPRSLGVMATYNGVDFHAALSVMAESKATILHSNELGKTGWGATCRLLYRPLRQRGEILQIGWSGAVLTPQYNADEELNHKSFTLGANFPTSVASVRALDALVPDARDQFKFTPELLAARGRVALESQYYYARVGRRSGLDAYKAYGAYATLRGILRGDDYAYAASAGRMDTPSAKSLELALSYNYTCLTDNSCGIRGGRLNDISCTLNWYINRYIIWRLRASYTHCWNRADADRVDLGAFQTRVQIIF